MLRNTFLLDRKIWKVKKLKFYEAAPSHPKSCQRAYVPGGHCLILEIEIEFFLYKRTIVHEQSNQ